LFLGNKHDLSSIIDLSAGNLRVPFHKVLIYTFFFSCIDWLKMHCAKKWKRPSKVPCRTIR
jgi:hypothetical protein